MKKNILRVILLFCFTSLAFGQTSTVTVNTSTKVTQPPVGKIVLDGSSNFFITRGSGTPESVVTSGIGSLYLDYTNGKLYIKVTGTGNTGWEEAGTGGGGGVSSWNGRTGAVVPATNDYSESQISFTDITTNDSSTSAHGYFPKLTGDTTLFFNGAGEQVAIPGSGSGVSQLISGGGVAWTGTGFNFIISAAVYMINGVQYSSAETPVTLDAADPTNDRIDVFYVDTSGLAGVITGTPGGPPVEPQVDPASQLRLTAVQVDAASTEPSITNENIYLENTEYTMSTNSAGTINLASTNNPYAGTKDIEGTSTVAGNFFTAVKPSGTLTLGDFTQLTFQIRSKGSWPKAKSISIFWLSGSTVIGSSMAVKDGTFGFDSSNTSGYQQIVIPVSSFGGGISTVDRLRMAVSGGGSSIGWYIDNIILQAGGGGGGGGGTVTNFSAGDLSPLFTTVVTNPNTTPNLAFSLSLAGGNTYFGNATGGLAAPSYTAAGALTKTDDTNVTLTLGGNPSTALLRAASLTVGWSGTLGLSRGGLATDATSVAAHKYFGNNTGSSGSAGFNTIDYSELSGTPTIPDAIFKTIAVSGQSDVVADSATDTLTLAEGSNITITTNASTDTITIASSGGTVTHAVTFVVDGGESAITAGTYAYIKIPYGGTLTGWTLIGSPSGSVTVDIYRATDTNGLPVTSIVGGGGTKPALSTAVENKSTSFTGWTSTTLNAFDNLGVAISGVTATTYCALTLYYQ